jgi:hypothetical protein
VFIFLRFGCSIFSGFTCSPTPLSGLCEPDGKALYIQRHADINRKGHWAHIRLFIFGDSYWRLVRGHLISEVKGLEFGFRGRATGRRTKFSAPRLKRRRDVLKLGQAQKRDNFTSLDELEGLSLRISTAPRKALNVNRTPKNETLKNEGLSIEAKNNSKDRERPPPALNHQKELLKLFSTFSSRHSLWQVFSDFCEMGALAYSNAVDFAQFEKREERYLQIVKGYKHDELDALAKGLSHLTLALEDDFGDVLGRTYHDLELHNKWVGQYFSPYPLCRMMAQMTIGDSEDLREKIKERGFVTAEEPACGSGAMVIALAHEMRDAGINYQEHLHVTAIDVDAKCAHMAYLQFSLLYIPAIIVHGNTLSLKEYGRWYTPAHIMGGWNWRLKTRPELDGMHNVFSPPAVTAEGALEPVPETELGLREAPAEPPPRQLKLF